MKVPRDLYMLLFNIASSSHCRRLPNTAVHTLIPRREDRQFRLTSCTPDDRAFF